MWPAPSFSGGIGLACAVVPPDPPSNVFRNRGTRCTPGGGCAPCTLLGEMRKAPSFHLAHRPTLLGTEGLTILPRKQRPLRPAWGRRGAGTLPSLPPSTRAGTEAPPGGGRGDGTVAKRYQARSQRGHSPVKRGHSAVIAPTAVRPRCDGLFPARSALGRFPEQGGTLYLRRGLRSLHPAWGRRRSAWSGRAERVERGNPAICADAYPCQRRPSAAPGLPCRSPIGQKVSYRR